ncbi:uncharacterized protein LOC100679567 isoform X4 [Nasonia vitripennis]|uniref:Ig-like domain-containing protein n=1 Tax=Nasonia vitripennis TaxID=7425 RepID=A0A7M7QLV8_NASVI|nr:uncharacterized protein LOC100679567 isoform X4 [Nasonia vitripennis]
MSSVSSRYEAVNILEALESEIAYVPGGRDRENRALIVLDIPAGEPLPITRKNLELLIDYFLDIFSEDTQANGLTLLVDARSATWRSARSHIRQACLQLGPRSASVIAVRPDGFWDNHRVDNYCTKSHRDGEPIYVSLNRLCVYVDPNQLTYNLGGSKSYDHAAWIQNRVRVDEFITDAQDLIAKMDEQKERLSSAEMIRSKDSDETLASTKETNLEMMSAAQRILRTGRHLTSSMSRESAQDVLDTVQRIHKLIDSIEQKQVEIEKAWIDMERNIDILKEIESLEEGVASVTNWILGPADSMLNSHYQIGFDVASSEELRREHEKLELECRETYGNYAELLHKIDSISSDYLSEDLKSQRDFMDFVCRSFATRLERRRNVLITSQRFFRLVSEYFDKTSEVFDKLIMGSRTCSFSNAGAKLAKLEKSQHKLEGLERELVKEGEKLSDILSMPVKDALCRDVQIDYGEDIINIQDILDATNARKNIFNDSVELQKLTLKQIALVHTYESDAEQAIRWLDDLFDVLVSSHVEIGCNVAEIQTQKQEHQSFQETARGTYEYGCQLMNGARVLRISCKLDLDDNTLLMSRLRQAWRQLRSVGQEQLTRLRVCAVFHRNVTDHCSKLREMIETVSAFSPKRSRSVTPLRSASASPEAVEAPTSVTTTTTTSAPTSRHKAEIRDVLTKREKLLPEVGRMVRLGRLLRSRLKEPLAHQSRMSELDDSTSMEGGSGQTGGNLSAVQSISAKLLEVTRLAEKLDKRLCEAGARSQALNPAHEDDEEFCKEEDMRDANVGTTTTTRELAETSGAMEKRSDKLEETNVKETESHSQASDRSAVEDSNVEEYVTATECSTTPVPRSRSESFLSSEYEDALVSTTCRKAEDEMAIKKAEVLPIAKCETTLSTNPPADEEIVEYSPDGATVIQRMIQEKSGKIVKEVTETTTLRVSHNTHIGVDSYKLVSNVITDHTDNLDYRELQDLNRTILNGDCPSPLPLTTHREEHTYCPSANTFVNYHKSVASGKIEELTDRPSTPQNDLLALENGRSDEPEDLLTQEEKDFLTMVKTSGEYLRLKVLDIQPELTKLGVSPEEAKELLNAHDEVLLRLQDKQSPVEELLRQADRVISTQKPKAEVYKAMAETLAAAWKDVNDLLERRKQILERNVLFQCRAEECKESMKALEMACNDTLLPIEIEAVKDFLRKIHELRKTMLETLMGALKDGKVLLDRLREIANEGTLDSRPDRIKSDADNAIHKVEGWLEALHDKRRLIELSFRSRKTQLEQCLGLALLATDLRELEDTLTDRVNALSNSNDHLGDSSASAELLLFELRKLQVEAKDFQDRALKITKSTEHLVSSGHFAGEQATDQAYAILGAAADYMNDLDQYELMLHRALAFFKSAQSVYTKLDQLEIQLATTDHPPRSAGLARLHAQSVKTLEDVTVGPLAEGHALLEITGRGAPGAEGVKRTVEEIEDRKIRLLERCTAHREENVRISRCISDFLQKYDELSNWLSGIVEAFLRGHQDMGSDLTMARDFYKVHEKLMEDLDRRADEVRRLDREVVPSDILEHLQDTERADIFDKVEALRSSWNMSRSALDARLQLAAMYVDFHQSAADLEGELDQIEESLKGNADNMSDVQMEDLERKWATLQPRYVNLTSTGKKFLEESRKIVDSYLDVPRACLCIESIMEKFANKQFNVQQKYEHLVTTVTIEKEIRIEQEKRLEESTRTIQWVSKFREQLFPVITCESTKPTDILRNLESSRLKILPELNDAVTELDSRIKSIEGFGRKDDKFNIEIKTKLAQVSERLRTTASDYKSLLDDLISIFEKISQVEQEIDAQNKNAESSSTLNIESLHEVRALLERLDSLIRSTSEIFKRAKQESEKVIVKIQNMEPADAACQDIEKLNQSFRIAVEEWNSYSSSTKTRLQERLDFCLFGDDLDKINAELRDLAEQLATITGWLGESLAAARGASEAFTQFEKTLDILEKRVEEFIRKTEVTVGKNLPKIENELSGLKNKLKTLKNLTEETRQKINSSIEYFELLEEAKEWFKEGSKLLIIVARKATSVKAPEDANTLLQDIDAFLKPGEDKQEKRIEKIRELSTKIFGTDRLPQFNDVVVENREMLDSFAVISSELRTLSENLRNTEDLREKLQREREEAAARVKEAQAEASAAQAAVAEAENARKFAERLSAETLERAAEEARRIALVEAENLQKAREVSTASAQTEAPSELDGGPSVVKETITKEIHIVEKTEIEEEHISTIKQEQTPIIEPAEIVKEQTIISEERQQPMTTTPILLEPAVKPEFTVPLYDATIQEGERFTFECRVVGHPRPEISWHKDGIPILNNPDYLTKCEPDGLCTLTIEETFAEDSAKFSCKAANEVGAAETEAVLKVRETSPEEQLSPPLFVKELSTSVALEGSTHQLECNVQGNPLPTVQWFKNDVNIDNSPDYVTTYNNGEAILKFEEVYIDDQGTYTCKAANRIGHAATSATLTVKVTKPKEEAVIMELPTITKPPSNTTIVTGEKVVLEFEAIGTLPISFIWTHKGKSLDEVKTVKIRADEAAGRSGLELLEAYPKDAGRYEVTARNAAGEATAGCDVAVKVRPLPSDTSDSEAVKPALVKRDMEPKAPRIQLPLRDLSINEGASARLDCIIVGQPEPEVIWYHDDRPVKESADFQLLFQGDRCSLLIHEAFLDDAGVYKVVAINTCGEASSECRLTIQQRSLEAAESSPKFVKLLTDLLIAEGEEARFECAVTGEPKPSVIWHLNGEVLVENERVKIVSDETGRSILKINPTTPDDKGNYTAKATNRVGEAKSFAKLVVKVLSDFQRKDDNVVQMEEKLVPPYFKEKFESRLVPEGITTKFECIAVGKPSPKIQWFFNERPVHGKDFLVSVSGDRQVLTIPEVGSVHAGNISCVAENAAGKAVCEAKIEVGGGVKAGEEGQIKPIQLPIAAAEMQASSSSDKYFSSEKTAGESGLFDSQTMTKTSSSIMESSTTHTSMKKEYVSTTSTSNLSSCPAHQPTSLCVKKTSQSSEQSSAYNGAPPVVQSQKIEEFERIVQDAPDEIRQEKRVIITQDSGGTRQKECKHQVQVQKPCRKQTAPRFVSPVTGMIVDQGSDIILEGIVDGFPQPLITWTKNGAEIQAKSGIKLSYDHNHVKLEIKDVKVRDAGRYTCAARNEVGNASSTADLVVKKTIFPPVFGRRLQAQVVKKGDRVIMEVEITGTPDPTVTWYKDDEPLIEPEYRMKQQGNCYLLLIDKAEKEHAGKYMVRATNAGGEAQSIADFAVFEPTPDTMVEMHKTLVYENVADKNAKKLCCGQPTEIPGANLTTEQITTTMIQPSAAIKTPFPPTSSSSTIRTVKSTTTEENQKASRTEMISSSVESHRSETKSEQKFHMKLEHKPAPFDASKREEKTETTESTRGGKSVFEEKTELIENENIETSTMARKDALSFFESMSKGSDSFPKGPKEMIKLTDEDDGTGPGCDVRVDQLTKNYERTTKFEEAAHEAPKPDIKAGKRAVQDIFNKFEKSSSSSRGIDNTMFDFPYEEHKLAPLECTRTILEDVTASGSPIHGTLTISKLAAQSESAEAMLKGFNLVPEPPPEIGYAPKPEEMTRTRPDVSLKAKQLQESFEKSHSPIDAPVGGVKIFPTAPPKAQPKPQEKTPTRPLSIPPPFELGKSDGYSSSTSTDALAMEKNWAHKSADSTTKSWPPQQKDTTTTFTDKQEWSLPEQNYKVSASESKKEVELKPEYRCTQTTIESSSSLEKKSFGSKETRISETKIEPPPSPPKPKPIIYNAETIKVDHTVNTIEEKSVTEKYRAECDVHKTETTEKKYESVKKQVARPWPDGTCDLRAPGLVKSVSDFSKPVVKMYHASPAPAPAPCPLLQPGTPPEIGYAPGPYVQEKKVEKVEKTYERSFDKKPSYTPSSGVKTGPSPVQTKKTEEYISRDYKVSTPTAPPTSSSNRYSRTSFYSESEYESEIDNTLKSTSGYRHVQAPVSSHTCRPRSTEPEPFPPSSFEVPSSTLTGPPRPVVTPDLKESSVKKTSTLYEKDSRQYQQKTSQSQQYGTLPKPGSPPVYVQPTKSCLSKPYKPESPKFKPKSFQAESGYMADTDEPLRQQQQKSFSESYSSLSESKSSFMESKSYSSSQKGTTSSSFSQSQSYSSAPKTEMQRSSFVEKVVEKSPQPRYRPAPAKEKTQVSQSSSRFAKGEFRESDYESDYDGSKISSLWKPQTSAQTLSDTKSSSSVKSVKSSFSSSGKPATAPPSAFAETAKESITKRQTVTEEKPRPKSVLLPGSPPEMAYAPPRQSFYEGHSGVPYHNAVGTEMKKTVRMDESTENTRRIITVEQTSRVIKFGENQTKQQSSTSPITGSNQQPQRKSSFNVPTPKKFIQGQFRESDYESEADTSRIRAKWAPSESESEEPRYRKVQPPRAQAIRSPIITMPPSESEAESERRSNRTETTRSRQIIQDQSLKPGSPPEFAFAPGKEFKTTANHVATKHISDMTSSFKSKTEKFASDIQSDLKKRSKPILKRSTSQEATSATDGGDDPRTYREESRVAQYGTKHIDPNTGLIYFKYDFGYEFGIVLPGEGKRTVASSNQSYKGHRNPGDIEVPIVHEFTSRKENGFKPKGPAPGPTAQNCHTFPRKSAAGKFGKSVKWEPTSESEFSEAEDFRGSNRMSVPPSLLIPSSPSTRWDPTSPSPVSLSPSLPSLSPRYGAGPPSNVESTPGSPWSATNGERIVPIASEVVKPYIEILPKKAPLFITPLRDIAVVSGQTARFECIVQAEPQPNIIWSKDGRIVENSVNSDVYYRNGVCRLTLPRTTPDDAGTYVCTATNSLGSTVTSATLQVPGNRRSVYGI